jgi:hypothetical protein
VPDNDNDPFLFLLEFDADSGPPEFLTLNVVDSVTGEFSNTQINLAPVPEPATSLLFVTGLIGLAAISRKKLRKK